MALNIKAMKVEDWPAVSDIYLKGIQTGNATFQTEAPTWDDWDRGHCRICRLVLIEEHKVVGWAALSPVSSRAVYAGVAEVSIYIAPDVKGAGYGTKLLNALIDLSEKSGYWTLQASIFVENKASLALHKKCGFREIGIRENIGKMNTGEWRTTMFIERRSKSVGIG